MPQAGKPPAPLQIFESKQSCSVYALPMMHEHLLCKLTMRSRESNESLRFLLSTCQLQIRPNL